MNITFDQNAMKKMFENISFEVEKQAHDALYEGVKSIKKYVHIEARNVNKFRLSDTTFKRYRYPVKNKRYRIAGKKYEQRSNYDLDAREIHFKTKKIRHKFGNKWLRAHLRVNADTNETTDKYWSFIKGFYSNFKGEDRTIKKTNKNVGKIHSYDFFDATVKKHFDKVVSKLNNMKF